jgi:hypothetical protein
VSKRTPSPKGKGETVSGRRRLDPEAVEILRHRSQYVVVDTDSDYVYIGKLLGVSGPFITLGDADVHNRRESSSSNEKYVLESKKYGIKRSRREVHIRLQRLVSFSLLEDVIDY